MAATVVIGALRLRHNPARLIPDSAVVLPVVALFAVLVLGVAWSDTPTRPANSVLILFLYVAFLFVARHSSRTGVTSNALSGPCSR
jgi:hypothetical protein